MNRFVLCGSSALVLVAACGDGATTQGARSGRVLITQTTNGTSTSNTAVATFLDATGIGGISATCTTNTQGPCQVNVCAEGVTQGAPDSGSPVDASWRLSNAGTISIAGGAMPVTLRPRADGTYEPYASATLNPFWTAGTILTVAGEGATVPMFTTMVATPTTVTVTAPALSVTTPLSVPRNADLALTWTGGAAGGQLTANISAQSATGVASVVCTYNSEANTGIIPAAALGMLPAGMTLMSLDSTASSVVTAGDWRITVSVSATPINGVGSVVLQ